LVLKKTLVDFSILAKVETWYFAWDY
jgi:hypothetical protein